MFRRGLKDRVKDEIIRMPKQLTTLKNLVKAAIELDDYLYERIIEQKFDIIQKIAKNNKMYMHGKIS